MGQAGKPKLGSLTWMGLQPAALGLELADATDDHPGEKDDKQALRVGERSPALGKGRMLVLKALEERRIAADVVSATGSLHSTPPEGFGEHSVW